MMNKHKFTINAWVFNESTCTFSVDFSVASQEEEDCEFFQLTVPYNFEEPAQFMSKLHSMMVLYVNNTRNFELTKQLISGYSFIELAKSVEKYNTNQENEE